MSIQHEITKKTDLLDEKGYVLEPGWARHNDLFTYNRENISANKLRIKEWDFYQICDGKYMTQFTIANVSLAEAGCVTITDITNGHIVLCAALLHPYTVKTYQLPRSSCEAYEVDRNYGIFTMNESYDGKRTRHLVAEGRAIWPLGFKFKLDYTLEDPVEQESISIVTPWTLRDKKGSNHYKDHFFYTNKINCIPVTGYAKIGFKKLEFTPDKTFAVLDWARGVMAHKMHWFWSNGTVNLGGKLLGWEVTYDIADDTQAAETCIFYDGKAHKIGNVEITYDEKHPKKNPWHFHEENGRFEMTMIPTFDNSMWLDIGIAGAKNHQCHGLWSGTLTLDDGTVITLKDEYAFCETVTLKW